MPYGFLLLSPWFPFLLDWLPTTKVRHPELHYSFTHGWGKKKVDSCLSWGNSLKWTQQPWLEFELSLPILFSAIVTIISTLHPLNGLNNSLKYNPCCLGMNPPFYGLQLNTLLTIYHSVLMRKLNVLYWADKNANDVWMPNCLLVWCFLHLPCKKCLSIAYLNISTV